MNQLKMCNVSYGLFYILRITLVRVIYFSMTHVRTCGILIKIWIVNDIQVFSVNLSKESVFDSSIASIAFSMTLD